MKALAPFSIVILIIAILALALKSVNVESTGNQVGFPTSTPVPITMNNREDQAKLKIEDEKVGTGAEAVTGKEVTVNYAGTFTDGAKFDSSYDRNQPFKFMLGGGEVIKGWDEGVVGMKVGGKRKLTVPPDLGYGPKGYPPVIPGNATLIFEVELLGVQ